MAAVINERAKIHVVTCDSTNVHKDGAAPDFEKPLKKPSAVWTRGDNKKQNKTVAASRIIKR
ncbi:MAG: hypothetical protein ACJA12_000769 [Glaciecola sp.]|jgi:hypothetical protein